MSSNDNKDIVFEWASMIDPSSTALVVVDIQQKLLPHIHDHNSVVRQAAAAIDVAGLLEMPIIVTEQYVKGLGSTVDPIKMALDRYNAYKPIEKVAFSCFGCAPFAERISNLAPSTIALVGIESHVCVMQTALDALDSELDVYYLAEATGSRNPAHKEEAIHRVRDGGAIIGSVEMFAFEAMRSADHPNFRTVQKVIK